MKKSILAILATVAAISASAATVKDLSDKEVLTIDANTTWYGTTGQSPINVPSGRTAVINIKKGVTFTVYGADADGTACAVPAIYVPPTATLYITGEGKLDHQSVMGKVIGGIAERTKAKGVPLLVVCGMAEESDVIYDAGLTAVFPCTRYKPNSLPSPEEAEKALYHTCENIFRMLRIQ